MRKVKVLAIILVLAMMLTGAAYALWDQNITVTSQAEMGNMDIQIDCASIQKLSTMPGLGAPTENYFQTGTPSISEDKHGVSFSVTDVYPGAKYGLNFTVRNAGDVPARITGVTFTSSYPDLFAQLDGSFIFAHMREVDGPFGLTWATIETITVDQCDLANLGAEIAEECADVILYPGDELIPVSFLPDVPASAAANMMNITIDEDDITGGAFEEANITVWASFAWQQCDVTQYGF